MRYLNRRYMLTRDSALTFTTDVPVAWALARAEELSLGKRGWKPTLLRLFSETSRLLTLATCLIFLTTAHIAFAQPAVAELPVPLKRMIVTLPSPTAATTTAGTPAASAAPSTSGASTATTLPSTVNVNVTPTDRVVTTTKTTAAWVVPETNNPAPPGNPASLQAATTTTTKKVLNGTDECVSVSDVASPAKQAQPATAAAMLYFERSLANVDPDQVFTVTVDGDVTIELVTVVAFDIANRPIPLTLELKPGQQQNQTKCPFTTPICAAATTGQGGTGAASTGTGASGATGTTGTGAGASNATKPPATLLITIKGNVPAGGGVLRVTAPSKQIHAGAVTYHANKQRVWRQITIANGAQHGPQNTAGAQGGVAGIQGAIIGTQGGVSSQGCGDANQVGQNQPGQGQQGGAGQQTPPLPSWTVGAEVIVLDPTGKTVVLKGKLGTPILCDDLAVLDDAIQMLDAVIMAVGGHPDKKTADAADAVREKWKNECPKSLVRAAKLLDTVHKIEAEISDAKWNAVVAELTPHQPNPFTVAINAVKDATKNHKNDPDVNAIVDKLNDLANAADKLSTGWDDLQKLTAKWDEKLIGKKMPDLKDVEAELTKPLGPQSRPFMDAVKAVNDAANGHEMDEVVVAIIAKLDELPKAAEKLSTGWDKLHDLAAKWDEKIIGKPLPDLNDVKVALNKFDPNSLKTSPKPIQDFHDNIGKVSDGLKSVSEVAIFLDKLSALAKTAATNNPTVTVRANNAAATTLKSGLTDFKKLSQKLTDFTNSAKAAIKDAISGIDEYKAAQQGYKAAKDDKERDCKTKNLRSILGKLILARCGLANLVDHELTSVETVVQQLAVEIDADHKYVDLGTIIGSSGTSGVPANIGQLPRVVRLVNKLVALDCDPCAVVPTACHPCAVAPDPCVPCNLASAHCEFCASAPESVVIPTATMIYVDLPGCLSGTVTLAAALPPGPTPPDGGVGPGLPPNRYCGLTITEAFLNVTYLPVANTLDPGLRVVGANKKPAAAWLPLSAANGKLNYLQAESFNLTTEPADNVVYFDSRAGQIALKLPKTTKNSESIWSVSTSAANLTIDNTVDEWSTALNAMSPNLDQLMTAIAEHPIPAGGADHDPDPAFAGLCRLLNLDQTAKAGLGKIPNKSPRGYFTILSQKLNVATAKAKTYDDLNTDESSATTQITVIHRQVRQLKNRRGRDDFNPRLLELRIEQEDQHTRKLDDHIRRQSIGGELLDVVGNF